VLVRELFPRAALVTPNLDEAALLLGRPLQEPSELEAAAQALLALGAPAALLKGGHLPGGEVTDVLVQPGRFAQHLSSPRIDSRNVHGTGCTLSSAIAANLALGHDLEQAVRRARDFILRAIAGGANVRTGQGHGPLNHGHAPVASHRLASG
jgi:hydroxymethylpyrimidine/phosphomethylpyrimidine kinase